MPDNKDSMKETQDKVQKLSTDLITKETLWAVFFIGIVVIVMWSASWYLYISRT